MELLHRVVEGQDLTLANFKVLQSLQPLQHVQADVGDERFRGQNYMDEAKSANPIEIHDGSWLGGTKD
jgi:hypothetical protein